MVLAARLGLPALFVLVILAILVLGVACWVISSTDRADRVSRLLLAWRGNADCLARNAAAPSPDPAARLLCLLCRAGPDPHSIRHFFATLNLDAPPACAACRTP